MTEIRKYYDCITNNLAYLEKLLKNTTPAQALVSKIPPIPKGAEHEPVKEIHPENYLAMEAVHQAAYGFNDLSIKPPHSQKSARRYVGVIHIKTSHPNSRDIAELIKRINEDKMALEQFVVNNHKTRSERFSAIHDNCPGVMTLHLYRQIHCLSNMDIQSLRFSWLRKASLQRPNKEALLNSIDNEIRRCHTDMILPYRQLMTKVESTEESLLRIRRSIKVQPIANAVTKTKPISKTAPLPIIVIQEAPFESNFIPVFNAEAKRKTRSDKQKSTVLGQFLGSQIEQVDK